MSSPGRTIAIWHRRKATAQGEARPTEVLIDGRKPQLIKLASEADELDFVLGRYPLTWRPATASDALEGVQLRHCKTRKIKKGDSLVEIPPQLLQERNTILVTDLPTTFGGLQPGDTVLMLLGGSGDRLAYAISNPALQVEVRRLTPGLFKELRASEEDLLDVLALFKSHAILFRQTTQAERKLIRLKEALSARQEAMVARIACETRLQQNIVGRTFIIDPEGLYAAGSIEALYDYERANDIVFQNLLTEEGRRERELKKIVHELSIYTKLFEPIEGCGELIAARLIASIGDVRLFATAPKLKAFCGVHVLPDGTLPRRKRGVIANWEPNARQALWLLGDQFNRRPGSIWGQKLLMYKARFREKHSEAIKVPVKEGSTEMVTRYTDGHILKMAKWRTLTKFVEWLHGEWNRLEDEVS